MSAPKLSPGDIDQFLPQIPGWSFGENKISREYRFENFVHAFAFMTGAALIIERKNHHPNWSNVYNRVSVSLYTHDSDGVTQKDLDLALLLEGIARPLLST